MQHQDLTQTFFALFPVRNGSIGRSLNGQIWRAISKFHAVTDQECMDAISGQPAVLRAFESDRLSRFSVIRIEEGSQNYDIRALSRLLNCLKAVGVGQVKLYQESGSKNWQLFVFWSTAIDISKAAGRLNAWLERQQFQDLKFHSPDDHIVLPLQPGFAWLDQTAMVTKQREELSVDQAIKQFLLDLTTHNNDWQVVADALAVKGSLDQNSAPVISSAKNNQEFDHTDQAAHEVVLTTQPNQPDDLRDQRKAALLLKLIKAEGAMVSDEVADPGAMQLLLFTGKQPLVRRSVTRAPPMVCT